MVDLVIKKSCEKRLKTGHLWIFSNELVKLPLPDDDCLANVFDNTGKFLGVGYYNRSSLISVRMLNFDKVPDEAFFINRIESAFQKRKIIYPNLNSFRLVFGESDFLPGLIIDKYEDYFSCQILSLGMEKNKELVVNAILSLFQNTKGIIEKNQSKLRETEGLDTYVKIACGEIPDKLVINENGLNYCISLEKGQKTGFFFDQRENRSFVSRISRGAEVLDCYCNQGGFSLNAASGGANSVIGVDISSDAIESAKYNALINNFKNAEFVQSDVVDYLNESMNNKRKWDIIILDPPAFAKSKKSVPTAIAGYSKINRLAIKCIKNGGYLVTSSCSYHIDEVTFFNLIMKEAAIQKIQLSLIYRGMQAPDHPILGSMAETNYLKFFVFIVNR